MSVVGSPLRIEPLSRHRERIAEVAALLHAEWSALPPWRERAQIEARLARSDDEDGLPHTSVALTKSGALLGTASIKLDELPIARGPTYWLGEVFISPAHRGRHIGSALIAHCITFARRHGLPALHLYTPDQQALYHRFGWRHWREAEVNGERVTVMQLLLDTTE